MPEVITPHQVEQAIRRVVHALDECIDQLVELSQRAADAEVDHKREWAKALLAAAGSVDVRKATADVETSELYRERKVSEALRDATQERARALRSELSALQSISANIREAAR